MFFKNKCVYNIFLLSLSQHIYIKEKRFHMQAISLEELKNIQKEVLNEVVTFCNDNNIRYFLAYGTLLGAIRHKGYIPWDDDIDIHMPRPDYEKFIELYNKKKNSNYQVVTHELDKRYAMPFAKIFRKGTLVKEFFYKQSQFGVYVDIFPLDGIKKRWQAYVCGQCIRFMYIKTSVFCDRQTFSRKARLLITKMILLPFSSHFILKAMKKIATKYDYEKCGEVCSFGSRTAMREILPREVFEEHINVTFEGNEYRAPKGYDKYLTYKYGDYMQLPPEEQRISTHESQAYKLKEYTAL